MDFLKSAFGQLVGPYIKATLALLAATILLVLVLLSASKVISREWEFLLIPTFIASLVVTIITGYNYYFLKANLIRSAITSVFGV